MSKKGESLVSGTFCQSTQSICCRLFASLFNKKDSWVINHEGTYEYGLYNTNDSKCKSIKVLQKRQKGIYIYQVHKSYLAIAISFIVIPTTNWFLGVAVRQHSTENTAIYGIVYMWLWILKMALTMELYIHDSMGTHNLIFGILMLFNSRNKSSSWYKSE